MARSRPPAAKRHACRPFGVPPRRLFHHQRHAGFRSADRPRLNDLLTLRAWSYYHLRRYAEAERIFEAVAATGYGDAVSGLDAARASLRSAQSQ